MGSMEICSLFQKRETPKRNKTVFPRQQHHRVLGLSLRRVLCVFLVVCNRISPHVCSYIRWQVISCLYSSLTLANMNLLHLQPYISTPVIASTSSEPSISHSPSFCITLNRIYLLDLSFHLPLSWALFFTCNLFSFPFTKSLFRANTLLSLPLLPSLLLLISHHSTVPFSFCFPSRVSCSLSPSLSPSFFLRRSFLCLCFSPVNNENCLLPWMDYGCAQGP